MEVKKSDIDGVSFVLSNNVYGLPEFADLVCDVLMKEQENKYRNTRAFYFKCVATNSLGVYIIDDNDWNMFKNFLLNHDVRIFCCVPKEETTFVLKGFLECNTTEEIQEELEANASIPILRCSVMKNTKIPTCLVETTSDVTVAKLKQVIPTIYGLETKWNKYVSRLRVLYCLECFNWSTSPEDGFRRAQCLRCMETPIIVDMDSLVICDKCKTKHVAYTCPVTVEATEESEPSSSESTSFQITSKFQFPELTDTSKPEPSLTMNDFKYAETVDDYLNVIRNFLVESVEASSDTKKEEKKTVWNKKKKRN